MAQKRGIKITGRFMAADAKGGDALVELRKRTGDYGHAF